MTTDILLELSNDKNELILRRYLKFISSRPGIMIKGSTHLHHILPKALDFYPQYKSLTDNPWNGVHLTHREHFIAHWMLARAFPNSSQMRAFFHMTNILDKRRSQLYAQSRKYHHDKVVEMTQDPERNRKISESLTGVPKSPEHIAKLVGHAVTEETRQKLREANLGKVHTEESRRKMSQTHTGKPRQPHSEDGKQRISDAKKQQGKRWFNNGSTSKLMSASLDDTWVVGRLPWKP